MERLYILKNEKRIEELEADLMEFADDIRQFKQAERIERLENELIQLRNEVRENAVDTAIYLRDKVMQK